MTAITRYFVPAVLAVLGLMALVWKSSEISAYTENLRRMTIDLPIPADISEEPIYLEDVVESSSPEDGYFTEALHSQRIHRPLRAISRYTDPSLSAAPSAVDAATAVASAVASKEVAQDSSNDDFSSKHMGGAQPVNRPIPMASGGVTAQGVSVQGPEYCGSLDVSYQNGPIMASGVNLYTLWVSNSGADYPASTNPAATVNIVTDFTKLLGGSKYLNMITGYKTTAGVAAKNAMNLKTTLKMVVPRGVTSLNDTYVQGLVRNSINYRGVPVDSNGIYIVYFKGALPYNSFSARGSYGSTWCGYHTAMNFVKNGVKTVLKLIFVGDPSFSPAGTSLDASNLYACAAQLTDTPNGNPGADAMVNVLAHELFESMTDPQFNGYFNNYNCEVGDLCAWTFNDPTKPLTTNYNVQLGTRKYLLQQIWTYKSATQSTSKCALCYNGQC